MIKLGIGFFVLVLIILLSGGISLSNAVSKRGTKITVLGTGSVGATIAYTLALEGLCSELLLIDINEKKAEGEAMDIEQGKAFCPETDIRSGKAEDAVGSDIVIVTVGIARKPGQTRIDLAKTNVGIINSVMPDLAKAAPDAVYIIVSNPVDILTYAAVKASGIDPHRIIGSGTYINVSAQNVHGYVLGEHGDTAVIPWSLISIAGMPIDDFCKMSDQGIEIKREEIEEDVRTAGARVISLKGATYYAIAMSVKQLCESIIRDSGAIATVSCLTHGRYGTKDVCLSLPYVIGAGGIKRSFCPVLLPEEQEKLIKSSEALRSVIDQLGI